jgi:hypothetical protein
MVILRPTRKLRSLLPTSESDPGVSDTALGDWYVNRLVVDRRPLLLLVSSASLLPMLIPAREVRSLAARLPDMVAARLARCGIDPGVVSAEVSAMSPVVVAPTTSRSVLGIMVDFAKSVPYHLVPGQWDEDSLRRVEECLAQTPCHAVRPFEDVVFPEQKAPALLNARWLADVPLQLTRSVGHRGSSRVH